MYLNSFVSPLVLKEFATIVIHKDLHCNKMLNVKKHNKRLLGRVVNFFRSKGIQLHHFHAMGDCCAVRPLCITLHTLNSRPHLKELKLYRMAVGSMYIRVNVYKCMYNS